MGKTRKNRPVTKPVNDYEEDFFNDEEIQEEEPIDEIEALKAQIASLQAQLGKEETKKPGFFKRMWNALKRHKTEVAAVAGVVIGAGTALLCSAANNTPVEVNFLDGLPDNGDPEDDEEDEDEDDVDVTVIDI